MIGGAAVALSGAIGGAAIGAASSSFGMYVGVGAMLGGQIAFADRKVARAGGYVRRTPFRAIGADPADRVVPSQKIGGCGGGQVL